MSAAGAARMKPPYCNISFQYSLLREYTEIATEYAVFDAVRSAALSIAKNLGDQTGTNLHVFGLTSSMTQQLPHNSLIQTIR